MKFPLFFSFALLLANTPNAFAARKLALIGGGGEPSELNTTIFDATLNKVDGYLQKNKWGQVDISFNGGHSETEAIVNMKFNNATNKSNFSKESFDELIKNYEAQINKGDLKSGDQLLIMIDTHGAIKTANESTHQIAVGALKDKSDSDKTNLSGTTLVNMDAFKNLADLALKKGIKLGIVDFSCHSGNSMALANPNTCVISSTGKKHFGYNTFSQNFVGKMKAGKSLEDVFLDTRKSTTDNSFPMISTPAGSTINETIYPNLTPYLYYYDENPLEDKMTDYLLEASSEAGTCARQNQYAELQKQLEYLQAATALNMNKSLPEIAKIRALIAAYKDKQENYINILKGWGVSELGRSEEFTATAKSGRKTHTMTSTYSWKELLETDFDAVIKNVSHVKQKTKDAGTLAQFQSSIDMHTKMKARQMEILDQYPNLKDYKEKFKLQLNELKGTYALANKIAMEERKLYDAMYANLQLEKNQKNPCKDFVL